MPETIAVRYPEGEIPFWLNKAIFFSIFSLVLILPVAHTTSIRTMLLVTLLLLWLHKMNAAGKWAVKTTSLEKYLILFFAAILASFAFTVDFNESLGELKGEFLSWTLLFYFISTNVTGEKTAKGLVWTLVCASLFMALFAVAEFHMMDGSIKNIGYRADSLHHGYEAYAQYLITVMPFNLILLLRPGRARKLLAVIFIFNLVALYITFTRAAWIGLWVEFFILAMVLVKGRAAKAVAAALFIVMPVITVPMLPEVIVWHGRKGVEMSQKNPSLNTVEERLIVWKGAISEFAKNPFLPAGYGKDNFKKKFSDKDFLILGQAHSTFINTAIELGIQGLIALVLLIAGVMRMCFRVYKRSENRFFSDIGLAAFAMTAGFFTANLFAEFFIDDSALLFWLLIGLVAADRASSARQRQEVCR